MFIEDGYALSFQQIFPPEGTGLHESWDLDPFDEYPFEDYFDNEMSEFSSNADFSENEFDMRDEVQSDRSQCDDSSVYSSTETLNDIQEILENNEEIIDKLDSQKNHDFLNELSADLVTDIISKIRIRNPAADPFEDERADATEDKMKESFGPIGHGRRTSY